MAVRPTGWRRIALGAARDDAPAGPTPGATAAPAAEFARVERGMEISGRLVVEKPLCIEGEFHGEIESASHVLVTESGTVEAPIRARSVEIHGAVVGDVTAAREVVIHATGRLHGDVDTPSLIIHRGAFFNGRTRMYRPERMVQVEAQPALDPAVAPGPRAER
jgi:cytoskeletal protein CcmA (bactofilin family)